MSRRFGKSVRTGVCMRRIPQPRTVTQHAHPRRGKKAHLRSKLTGLLAAIVKVLGQAGVKEDYSLTHGHTILRSTEAKNVYASLPGHLRRAALQAGTRVRKPRSIHVKT